MVALFSHSTVRNIKQNLMWVMFDSDPSSLFVGIMHLSTYNAVVRSRFAWLVACRPHSRAAAWRLSRSTISTTARPSLLSFSLADVIIVSPGAETSHKIADFLSYAFKVYLQVIYYNDE